MKSKSMIITYSNLRHLLKKAGAYSQASTKCKNYLSKYFDQTHLDKIKKIQEIPMSNIEFSVNKANEIVQLDVILMYQDKNQKLHFININQLIQSKKVNKDGFLTVKIDASAFSILAKTLLETNAETLYLPSLWIRHHKALENLSLNCFLVWYTTEINKEMYLEQKGFEYLIYDKKDDDQFYFETEEEAFKKVNRLLQGQERKCLKDHDDRSRHWCDGNPIVIDDSVRY
ncbi:MULTISPECIES: hypothetical protein [Lactobacillaceae]|uniref:hypothetical protein n=1 Tax=Lactobacillaceae TaxID=33958 RepID=UPI00129E0B25|nr:MULTISPECIES: hypothetical protein [Lactobacillaceae]MRN06039.1 hypothetical protein [Lactobacillus sp. 0.1XD8-4]